MRMKFAILKKIKEEVKTVQLLDGSFLEYDENAFLDKVIANVNLVSTKFGKTSKIKKEKSFSMDDIEKMLRESFDMTVNEIKNKTLIAKTEF